jgi:tetratricopeptide (TPR) repeat protein
MPNWQLMLRNILVFGFLLSTIPLALSQKAPPVPATLFLTSSPINAQVLHNGEPLVAQTPLLLRDLPPGKHTFELRKEGYPARKVRLELAAGEVKSQVVDLAGGTFQPAFLNETEVLLAGKPEKAAGVIFQLPEGDYRIRRAGDNLIVEPRYRLQGAITGLNIGIPLALAFSGLLTVYDVLNPPNSAFPLSAATLSSYGVTAGLAGFDLVLHLKRRSFRKAYSYSVIPLQDSPHVARDLYERAEELLAQDRREEALHFYGLVVHEHPDSVYLPQALFKTAKVHFLTEDDTLAILEFQLLVTRYPLPELYDKAQKSLADLYARQQAYPESLAHLDAMLFVDPLYSHEDIDLYRCEVLGQWAAADPAQRPALLQAWRALVERYPDSPRAPEYRQRLDELQSEGG